MAGNVEHKPITGVCIVSNPEKCPPGYEVVSVDLSEIFAQM